LVPGAVYRDGKVEVTTDHFSTFTVFEVAGNKTELTADAPKTLDGKALPNTATNSYNLLFAGMIVLAIGSVLVFVRRRKQA
jgi:LPXTG-motif cell wall-anchored protein